jgi:hypothetical protein
MTHTTAQILASPITIELLHAATSGDITYSPDGWMLYGSIAVDGSLRRLVADDLIELPPTGPILTARGEDIVAMS